jgi:hypothetical protein
MRCRPSASRYGFLLALCLAGAANGQELLRVGPDGNGYVGASDLAVLSSDEKRNDLPCEVEPLDPELEYDLNFRAGYNAKIPLASLAGDGNSLRVVFRVTPLDSPDEPVYMRHRYGVPAIKPDAVGAANLPGKFRLGPGKYKINGHRGLHVINIGQIRYGGFNLFSDLRFHFTGGRAGQRNVDLYQRERYVWIKFDRYR